MMPEEPATPDPVELARRGAEAFNRGDIDDILALYARDAVWDGTHVGGAVFEGREAIRDLLTDWFGPYEDFEQVIEELRDLGNGVGLGVYVQRGRPAGSSGFVELRYAGVGIVRDGLIQRLTLYTDIGEARAAAERLAERRVQAVSKDSTTPDLEEKTRQGLDAVNRRDFDALLPYAAPDVVYDTTPSGFGVYKGVGAIRDFIEGYWRAFDELRFELEEFRDLGNGVTFAVNRQHARPAGSTAPVEAREAHVTEWADGLTVRIAVHTNIDQARAAAERLAEERG